MGFGGKRKAHKETLKKGLWGSKIKILNAGSIHEEISLSIYLLKDPASKAV